MNHFFHELSELPVGPCEEDGRGQQPNATLSKRLRFSRMTLHLTCAMLFQIWKGSVVELSIKHQPHYGYRVSTYIEYRVK